jgi:hypothetical protein
VLRTENPLRKKTFTSIAHSFVTCFIGALLYGREFQDGYTSLYFRIKNMKSFRDEYGTTLFALLPRSDSI